MVEPFGRCPICQAELIFEEPLIVCPEGDYKAESEPFENLWIKFTRESGALKEPLDGLRLVEKLLADLRELNQIKKEIPDDTKRDA